MVVIGTGWYTQIRNNLTWVKPTSTVYPYSNDYWFMPYVLESTDIAEFNQNADYKEPTPRQKEIVDHLVSTRDKVADAASVLGLDRCNIYRELRKPHVKYYMYCQLVENLSVSSCKAVGVLDDLLDHKSGYIKLEAAKEVLNRSGIVTVERKQVSVTGGINVQIDLS